LAPSFQLLNMTLPWSRPIRRIRVSIPPLPSFLFCCERSSVCFVPPPVHYVLIILILFFPSSIGIMPVRCSPPSLLPEAFKRDMVKTLHPLTKWFDHIVDFPVTFSCVNTRYTDPPVLPKRGSVSDQVGCWTSFGCGGIDCPAVLASGVSPPLSPPYDPPVNQPQLYAPVPPVSEEFPCFRLVFRAPPPKRSFLPPSIGRSPRESFISSRSNEVASIGYTT